MTGKQKWLVGGAVATVLVASAVLILVPRKAPSFEKDSLLKEIQSTVKKSQAKIEEADFADLEGIVSQLKSGPAKALLSQLSPETQSLIASFQPSQISPELQQSLLKDLNAAMEDNNFYGGLEGANQKQGEDLAKKLSPEAESQRQGVAATPKDRALTSGEKDAIKNFNQTVLKDIYPSTHQMLQKPEPAAAKESLKEIQQDPTQYLQQRLSNETQRLAETAFIPKEISEKLKQQLARDLNQAMERPDFYAALEEEAKKQGEDIEKKLSEGTREKGQGADVREFNRGVVEDLFGDKILKSAEQQRAIAKAATDKTAKTKADQRDERTKGTNKPAVQPPETEPPVPGELNLLPGTEPFKLDSKGNAYVPGEIVVQISNRTNIDSVIQQLKGDVNIIGAEPVFHHVDSPALQRYYTLKVDNKEDIEKLSERLKQTGLATVAEPNYYAYTQGEVRPNDPYYKELWGLEKIRAPQAWEKIKEAPEILVAVVDTGIDYNHPDLKDNIYTNPKEIPDNKIDDDGNGYVDDYRGWDFAGNDNDVMDGQGHGTHVSGTIGAVGNNGTGVTGINWRIKILPVKGFPDGGRSGSIVDLANAVAYAANMGARVINNSWGGDGKSQITEDVMTYAYAKNCVIVVAAGNNNKDCAMTNPAYLPTVITVAASDPEDKKALFSNFGNPVDIGAPGAGLLEPRPGGGMKNGQESSILSTFPMSLKLEGQAENGYKKYQGTSMATPHVSGAAALVLAYYERQYGKTLSNEQVKQILRRSADKVISPEWEPTLGSGRLNLENALMGQDLPPAATITQMVHSSTTSKTIRIYGIAYSDKQGTWAQRGLKWRIDVKPEGSPQWIAGISQGVNEVSPNIVNDKDQLRLVHQYLGDVQLSDFMEGDCFIRLVVVDNKDQILAEDTLLFKVRHNVIVAPEAGRLYAKGEQIQIKGTIDMPDLDRFEFMYAREEHDFNRDSTKQANMYKDAIILANNGKDHVVDGVLATIDTSKLEDGVYFLRGTAYSTKGVNNNRVIKADYVFGGDLYFGVQSGILPGWPMEVANATQAWGGKSSIKMESGEIDKQIPGLETAVSIQPWDELVEPSPILTLISSDGKILKGWPVFGNNVIGVSSPYLVDLNEDGEYEIVISVTRQYNYARQTTLYAYTKNGTLYASWRLKVPALWGSNNGGWQLAPSEEKRDIDCQFGEWTFFGNGPETKGFVVANTLSAAQPNGYLFSLDKNKKDPFINIYPYEFYDEKIIPADLNGDGSLELCSIIGESDARYNFMRYAFIVFNLEGQKLWSYSFPDWKKDMSRSHYQSSCTVADLDQDGNMELIVIYRTLLESVVFIFRSNGSILPGWPRAVKEDYLADSIAVGNLDDEEDLELVGAGSKNIYAWKASGALLKGWPLKIYRSLVPIVFQTNVQQPLLAEINGDGLADVVYGDLGVEIFAASAQGTLLPEFPKPVPYLQSFHLADINKDGVTDLLTSMAPAYAQDTSRRTWMSAVSLKAPYRADLNPWPVPYHDFVHSAVYPERGKETGASSGPAVQFYPPQILSFTDPKAAEYSYGFGLLTEGGKTKESNWDVNNDWEKREWLKDASGTYVWTKLTQINTEGKYGYIDIATKDAEGKISETYRYRFAPRGELNKDPYHALPGEPPILQHPDSAQKPAEPPPVAVGPDCNKIQGLIDQLRNTNLAIEVRTQAADEIQKIPREDLQKCHLYNDLVAALVELLKTPAGTGQTTSCDRVKQLVDQLNDPKTSRENRLKAVQELGQMGSSIRNCPNYNEAVAALMKVLKVEENLVKYDLNKDGVVDIADIAIVSRHFGESRSAEGVNPEGDVNGDGVVDVADVALVSQAMVGTPVVETPNPDTSAPPQTPPQEDQKKKEEQEKLFNELLAKGDKIAELLNIIRDEKRSEEDRTKATAELGERRDQLNNHPLATYAVEIVGKVATGNQNVTITISPWDSTAEAKMNELVGKGDAIARCLKVLRNQTGTYSITDQIQAAAEIGIKRDELSNHPLTPYLIEALGSLMEKTKQ